MPYVRKTLETEVAVELRRGGDLAVETPIPFLTHMLETLLKYAGLGGVVKAVELRKLDDGHHVIEDVAIAVGRALDALLEDRRGIARFGHAVVPMDESIVMAAVDLGGRAYWVVRAKLPDVTIGGYPLRMFPHFVRTLAVEAKATIHIYARGTDPHHKVEAAHKALGLALRQALSPGEGFSTKGVLG
ncbi:imidazoleglycerol-phosphate dehydratase [Pyrobaculum aerophilum]|uniref:Imidazoleglycerol-phosphate dehydratase n=1 Tax=Pyrobaculum aerophilum TaxID=13773 RepID=A0A371R647_9CREN|nr:imidazoleglycerol-phosphate dehydratase [Pyrobaculum aerophilum]RFA98497.1 imidazoleglycerol-phosphate dehydratase [Pyrobaculum aerophilum]RFA99986.1 imidazoleglycerol-phosphate dehydratase [Pyrobaculum aerophilum]